ncbi:MAG TPA: CvpA family protein [Dehalococcoidia bacterium]|nr:CvpA family protein [Dehalococcoidia bacterium]
MSVNWVDAAILLTFFWFGFTGLAAGLLRTGITLLSFLLGIVLAGLFYQRLASDIRVIISNEALVRVISLLAIWLATALAGQLLAVVLKHAASLFFFGPLDGIGGLVLGLAKAFILVELILIAAVAFRTQSSFPADALSHSVLAPVFLRNFDFLLRLMPGEFRDAAAQFVGGLH